MSLLDDAERSLLETVAVFVDGWTIEAAAAVAVLDEDRALDLTEALAGHSLIYLDIGDLGPRSRMLETIREFVAERLAARPDVAEIQRRHADHYRALVELADRPIRHGGQGEWARRLQIERGNLALAVHWYMGHDRTPLPDLFRIMAPWAMWPFLGMPVDILNEARSLIDELTPGVDSLDARARAELLWAAAVVALESSHEDARRGRPPSAWRHCFKRSTTPTSRPCRGWPCRGRQPSRTTSMVASAKRLQASSCSAAWTNLCGSPCPSSRSAPWRWRWTVTTTAPAT